MDRHALFPYIPFLSFSDFSFKINISNKIQLTMFLLFVLIVLDLITKTLFYLLKAILSVSLYVLFV